MKALGIILIIAGILLTTYTSVTIFRKKKVLDIGSIEISRTEPETTTWSPLIGVVIISAGALILWQANQKR